MYEIKPEQKYQTLDYPSNVERESFLGDYSGGGSSYSCGQCQQQNLNYNSN